MAELLKESGPDKAPPGWWPVDVVSVAYLAAAGALIAAYFPRVPGAWWLIPLHAAGILLVWAAVNAQKGAERPAGSARMIFRHWYAVLYVIACYKEMALLIPAIRGVDYDAAMSRLDRALWGVDPVLWLDRAQSVWLTEFLQIAYTLFIPAVLLVAALLWRRRMFAAFRDYAFLISLGFLASYMGYLLVPVRGPRFFLAPLDLTPLRGAWFTEALRHGLDQLESAHYDCFPSGHTELTLLAFWTTRRISRKLFAAYAVYSICIILATVYLRYHYTVDVLAGGALAIILLALAPRFFMSRRPCAAGLGPRQ